MDAHDVTHFEEASAFRGWLHEHHADRDVLWVGFWKVASGRPSLTWPESVDEALCFGWIDGLRKRVDAEAYTIRFTPRRRTSIWSARNVERYSKLEAGGLVEPSGRAAWEARSEDRTGVYSFERKQPVELASRFLRRLEADVAAWDDWIARPPGYRRTAVHWVMGAKREATRERRFLALLGDSAAGRKIGPLR